MKPRPAEALAGYEPPSRQTLRTPLRAPRVCARFQLPPGFDRSRPCSVIAPRSGIRAVAGNCKLESRAAPRFRFHPDPSTLALDDLLAKRQTDARTGDFAPMQAFKHAEHPLGVSRFDPDSVVPHGKQTSFPVSLGRNMDSRRFPASELDRIRNQVLEKLRQHNLLGYHGWQGIGSYDGAALRDGSLEVEQGFGQNRAAIEGREAVLFPPGNLPIGQQGLQQGLDSQGALHGIGDELVRFSAQLSFALARQELRKVHYHPYRFLQVVGESIGEMLQFGIGRG